MSFLPIDETFYPKSSLENPGCFGIRQKYRLCKDDKCKVTRKYQMRNEQCAAYNHVSYQGQYFTWLSQQTVNYMGDYINECLLHCKAKETNRTISWMHAVIDGTPCQRPAIYYSHHYRGKAVCVEEICRVSVFFIIITSSLSSTKGYAFDLTAVNLLTCCVGTAFVFDFIDCCFFFSFRINFMYCLKCSLYYKFMTT